MSRLRRPIAVLAMLLAGGGLSACGNRPDKEATIQRIEGEGYYLSLGELKYQVQISRQINPDDAQDKPLLIGVPAGEQQLESDEVWFGVFLQVENESDQAVEPSGEIEIIDTQEEVFTPLDLDDTNPFVYRASAAIPAREKVPLPDTPAFDTAIQGSMLLFKLKSTALDNRPLELKIESSTNAQTGIIDLDV